ncbi:gastrotropin [Arapaima gigas]
MAFTGKYEIESQENHDEFLKLLGIPDDIIEKGRNFKIITEVVQNGNEFTWSQVYPSKTMTNKFVIDQESEMETMTGKKFKATVSLVDGKVTVNFPKYHHTAEICGGKLVECSTISGPKGNVTMKRISKRIS